MLTKAIWGRLTYGVDSTVSALWRGNVQTARVHDSQVQSLMKPNKARPRSPETRPGRKEIARDQLAFFLSCSHFLLAPSTPEHGLRWGTSQSYNILRKSLQPCEVVGLISIDIFFGEVDFHLKDRDNPELDGRPLLSFHFSSPFPNHFRTRSTVPRVLKNIIFINKLPRMPGDHLCLSRCESPHEPPPSPFPLSTLGRQRSLPLVWTWMSSLVVLENTRWSPRTQATQVSV